MRGSEALQDSATTLALPGFLCLRSLQQPCLPRSLASQEQTKASTVGDSCRSWLQLSHLLCTAGAETRVQALLDHRRGTEVTPERRGGILWLHVGPETPHTRPVLHQPVRRQRARAGLSRRPPQRHQERLCPAVTPAVHGEGSNHRSPRSTELSPVPWRPLSAAAGKAAARPEGRGCAGASRPLQVRTSTGRASVSLAAHSDPR